MRLAVIIPTLNEERTLGQRLDEAIAQADIIIVSDGGSEDRTVEIAQERGAIVVLGGPGRGQQLNRGARTAIAEGAFVLLFLHADTALPSGARETILSEIEAGAVGGGCLIRLDNAKGLLALAPALVNRRTRRFQIPLGDQAQFATATAFDQVGGFSDWPILEDLDFIKRLKLYGRLATPEVFVSPDSRRFQQEGVLRTVVRNWFIWTLHAAGVKPTTLAKLYRHRR